MWFFCWQTGYSSIFDPGLILCGQYLSTNSSLYPFFFQQHQQQVAQAVERAKQVTMAELNAIIGVRGLPGLPPTVCITCFHILLLCYFYNKLNVLISNTVLMPSVAEVFVLHTDFSRDKGNSLLCQNIILSSSAACNKTFPARNVIIRRVACLCMGIVWQLSLILFPHAFCDTWVLGAYTTIHSSFFPFLVNLSWILN